jgi:hypothetical protein
MPIIEYIYIIKSKRPPILAKDYIVMTKVLKIRYRLLPPRFRSLSNLSILKALRSVTAFISTMELIEIIIEMNELRATKKSKKFHGSLKYDFTPIPKSLIAASSTKIKANK